MAAFQIHGFRHHGFDLVLQIGGRESAIRIFRHERVKQGVEALVGIFGVGLAKLLVEHVHDPRALAVNHLFEAERRFRGVEAVAEFECADVGEGTDRCRGFFRRDCRDSDVSQM